MNTYVQENSKVVRSGATAAKHADYHMWPMILLAFTLGPAAPGAASLTAYVF